MQHEMNEAIDEKAQEMEEKNVSSDTPEQPKELDKETQAYISAMMKMLHDRQSSPQIVQMLKESPPEESIPAVALTLNDNFESQLKSQGKQPKLETLLIAGTYLVADLVEIGNAAQAFEVTEDQVPMLLQSTMQKYIERGLKDGSIDPVELQAAVEPLMGEEHKAAGIMMAEDNGLPMEANQRTAMEAYGRQREMAANNRNAAKMAQEQQKQKGMMQGPPQQQGGQ